MSRTFRQVPPACGERSQYVVLMPVYNDWEAARLLLHALDEQLAAHRMQVDVICVDDCSTVPPPTDLGSVPTRGIRRMDVVSLRRNLGHQRALAVGLCYVEAVRPCRATIVMDADGEDLASDVPRLIQAFESGPEQRIVFAQRTRRSEGLLFATFYHLYRGVHRLLTGIRVEVGNFSIVPATALNRLVVTSELWNHYAAAVVHSRMAVGLIPTERGRRLYGESRMNFVSLVTHGMSAMSVFTDRVGVRLLITTAVLFVLLFCALCVTVGIRLFTSLAIPGWATIATGTLLILLSQTGLLTLAFIFMIQRSRAAPAFIPARDYEIFIDSVTCI